MAARHHRVITTAAPIAWRRLAYDLAQVVRRAGRYDFASFPAPIGRGGPDPQYTRALLRAAEHAAVAPAELAWWTPLTDAGAALARSAAGPDGGV
jgi:hypothetical protein